MKDSSHGTKRSLKGRVVRWAGCGCATTVVLFVGLVVALYLLIGAAGPKSFPLVEHPIPPPDPAAALGNHWDGFESPYIGHTGSWDGKGGAMFGASKVPALDQEAAMGLRWTFMCVYWRAMEPDGPVDLDGEMPPAWEALDAFVIAAHNRKLNILMQAPVVGGNAGGPPEWAGRREPGKSAPRDMEALARLAGKLAARYSPGGTLAQREGWGSTYGVRAWELDNEPGSYRTNWKGQAADYAEFVTKAGARIREVDPHAVILAPALASGHDNLEWLEQTLDASSKQGSEMFRQQGEVYSIGPVIDVVSFHNYEGLDSFFAGEDYPVTKAFQKVRAVFEKWEQAEPGFEFERKQEYWHTEGNYDFLGILSDARRAAWRWQFFTRAFAAGIRKVTVMDANPVEQVAVKAYIRALPYPFPMLPATEQLRIVEGQVHAFRHPEDRGADTGRVWIIWAKADTGEAIVEVPVSHPSVRLVRVDGTAENRQAVDGFVRLRLEADARMPAPVIVLDRARD